MPYAQLIKHDGYYHIAKTTSPQMDTISCLLKYELCYSKTSHARDFVNNKGSLSLSGNLIFLDKDGDTIIIENILHDSEEDQIDRVVMSQKNFLDMLDQWDRVYLQKPDEILITQDDNGKITITGKFADGREI